MPELVKLYKNLRDFQLNNMLYKTKEGLQKEYRKLLILKFLNKHNLNINTQL